MRILCCGFAKIDIDIRSFAKFDKRTDKTPDVNIYFDKKFMREWKLR